MATKTAKKANGKTETKDVLSGREFYAIMNQLSGTIANQIFTRTGDFNRFDQKRDINAECGYPSHIYPGDYRMMYEREMGHKVVSFFPSECWKEAPLIYENEDSEQETEWEKQMNELLRKHKLVSYWERLDEMSRIGHYGVMLLGLNDGKGLEEPVVEFNERMEPTSQPKLELLYLRVFDESLARIATWNTDPSSPRYCFPETYAITFVDPNTSQSDGMPMSGEITKENLVHWTRVIHVADNRKSSEVLGVPAQQPVYNRLLDLRKLFGGSAEMFWQGAQPGIAFEVNPDIADAQMDAESIRQEFEKYVNKLQRYIAVQGVTAKSLSPQAVDPEGHVMVQLKAITIILDVPLRVFLGSEQAHLASSQDIKNWHGRVGKRQVSHCESSIIRETVDRFQVLGILPVVEVYVVDWPDLDTPTDMDKAEVADKIMAAIQKYVQSGANIVLTETFFWTEVIGFSQELAEQIVEAAEEVMLQMEKDESEDDEFGDEEELDNNNPFTEGNSDE